ncbi:hypothetical protein [Microbacterium sp. Root61]|uniref:hypothetical protein n=1 Tax=Microbacterium sp. Root61 TaxID=1736570 RepID=UPI0012E35A6F|nr:hypothetical protein [Microbacterium sp. Root61]
MFSRSEELALRKEVFRRLDDQFNAPGGTRIRKCAFSLATPSCIQQQLPRNYADFREFDRIAEHAETLSCRQDAGKLRAKNPQDSGAKSGFRGTRFCPHPWTPQYLSTLINT